MIYKFAPSDVTFANCDRCYYLNKKFGIKYEKPFPVVFSTLDVSQKKYFIDKKLRILYRNFQMDGFLQPLQQI